MFPARTLPDLGRANMERSTKVLKAIGNIQDYSPAPPFTQILSAFSINLNGSQRAKEPVDGEG